MRTRTLCYIVDGFHRQDREEVTFMPESRYWFRLFR
jgi:hypothetical protein